MIICIDDVNMTIFCQIHIHALNGDYLTVLKGQLPNKLWLILVFRIEWLKLSEIRKSSVAISW